MVLLIFVSGKVVLTGESHSVSCLFDTHLLSLSEVDCACANSPIPLCLH